MLFRNTLIFRCCWTQSTNVWPSLSLESLRQDGVSPWRIIGLLAWVAGITDRREPVHPRELVSSFRWESLPRDDYVLTSKDMQWLGKENMNVC